MAISTQQIIDFLLTNPSDADVAKAMETYSISPADVAKATGTSEGEISARVAATLPPNQAVLLGDTYVQAINETIGSGQDQQVGGLQNVITYKADDNKVGGGYKQYTPTGELERTGTQQEVNSTKDFMDFALTAGTLFGLPAGIGESLGLTGATGQAVGQGLLTTGTKLGGGENLSDALKAGLISGSLVYGGSQLGDYIKANTPIDASNMTSAQFNDALETQLISEMQAAGLSKDQISAFLDDMGIGQGLTTTASAPDVSNATDTVSITGEKPTTVGIGDVFATTPTLTVTGAKTPTTQQDVINAINTTIGGGKVTTPTIEITADKPKTTTIGDTLAAITTLPSTLTTTPVTTTPKTTTTTTKETDPVKVAQLALAAAGLLGAGSAMSGNGATQYPIVPIPESWATPPKPTVAPATQLPPIDFGNRNLLIGTQWEKFLNPNYGKVPEPVQYSQPSNLSYNDLMGILGSKQGMPSASSLSINDIISGIQNQYGQTASRTMG